MDRRITKRSVCIKLAGIYTAMGKNKRSSHYYKLALRKYDYHFCGVGREMRTKYLIAQIIEQETILGRKRQVRKYERKMYQLQEQ